MKRLLSILLAAALVIGMVPVFASAAEVQVINFTGHTGKTPLDVKYEEAGWATNVGGTCEYLLSDKWNTTTYLHATGGLYVYFDNAVADGERAAVDFEVNESGYYDVTVNVSSVVVDSSTKKPYDGYMCVWIDGKYAGELNLVKGKGANPLRPMYLEERKHTFFVCEDRTGNFVRYVRCIISDITLTPTTADNAALEDVFVSLENSSIGMGDLSKVYTTLLFGNGMTINLYPDSLITKKFPDFQTSEEKLELAVENTNLATISNNIVTGKDVGETEVIFTADLSENGTKSKSTSITINPKFSLRYKDETSWATSAGTKYYYSSETRGNNWTLVTDPKYTAAMQVDGSQKAVRIQSAVPYAYINSYGPVTLNLDAPYGGLYDLTIEHTAYSGNGKGDVYINDQYVGTFDDNGSCAVTETIKSTLLSAELVKGNNKVTIYPDGKRIFPVAIEFNNTEVADTLNINASISATELKKAETATISMSASASDGTIFYIKESILGGKTLAATYKSSNEKVATVSSTGVVTAVGAGEAEITVSSPSPYPATPFEKKFTVTVPQDKPGEAVATEVNVYVGATTGGTVTATGVTAGSIESVYAGKQISVTATEAEGYKFAYWKDSAGNHVSDSAKYSFKPYTNTSLIAVFDNAAGESEKIGVDFFDGNRAYLGFIEVVSGTAFGDIEDKPTYGMTGYKPMGWSISNDEKITSFVRAVALYEEETNPVSGITVNASGKNAHYGDEIETTVEGAKTWYRDEKLVAYGDTYTYLAWGETAITSSTEDVETKVPLVVLNKSGESYMIEYDNAGYEIVDAGIIFGNDAHKEVNSCYYKAKVKDIKAHGQFTAKPNLVGKYTQTTVRGYIIFKDNDESLRVIYAD